MAMKARPKSAAVYGKKPKALDSAAKKSQFIHDPEEYAKIKYEQSDPYFRQTRVSTCSHILTATAGKSVAIAYPLEKTGWKHPASYQNLNKSSETKSFSSYNYKKRNILHAGMTRKPLEPYNPNSYRSRLPVA